MELIVAASAAVIALCALVVSIISTYYMWKHNRQSIMPLLDLDMRKVRSERDDIVYHGVFLKNSGSGPAIVANFELSYGGFDIGDPRSIDLLRKDLRLFLKKDDADIPTFFSVLKKNEIIASGEGIILLGASFSDDIRHRTFQFMDEMCSKTQCIIESSSLYGDSKTVSLNEAKEAFDKARSGVAKAISSRP